MNPAEHSRRVSLLKERLAQAYIWADNDPATLWTVAMVKDQLHKLIDETAVYLEDLS